MTDKTYKIDFDQVRRHANGRWAQIYSHVGNLEEALKCAGRNRHVDCPLCGRKKFRLFKDYEATGGGICSCEDFPDGFMLLREIWGLGPTDTYELFKRVAEILGGNCSSTAYLSDSSPRKAAEPPKPNKFNLSELKRVHGECVAVDHPSAEPMRKYLESRGLSVAECPQDLLFHAGLDYHHEDDDGKLVDHGKHPCMVAVVRTREGRIVTLHRTYLSGDGKKAAVPEAKKLMAKGATRSVAGCCVQLDAPGPVLNLAEGIETAFSVRTVTGFPTWVAISAHYLPAFERPDGVMRVNIWIDLDRSRTGHRFAQELADRLLSEGIDVVCFTPNGPIPLESKSLDWNDVHCRFGFSGFPDGVRLPFDPYSNLSPDFEGDHSIA